MGHYKANVRDVEFALFEVLKADELLGRPPFEHVSRDDVQLVIREAARFAQEVFAEAYQQGDEAGCRLEAGQVKAPEVFRNEICSCGRYVPRYRLNRGLIYKSMGWMNASTGTPRQPFCWARRT